MGCGIGRGRDWKFRGGNRRLGWSRGGGGGGLYYCDAEGELIRLRKEICLK